MRFVELKGLRPRTTQTYLSWVKRLIEFYPEADIEKLTSRQVLDFLLYLQNDCKLAGNTLNQAVCALRTLFRDHLGVKWKIWSKIKVVRDEVLPQQCGEESTTACEGVVRRARRTRTTAT